jgi:hypothetical protein
MGTMELKEHEDQEELIKDVKVADGGCRAWMVCMATIWTFGVYLGFEFNYGLIYSKLIEVYKDTRNSVIYAGSYI